MQMILPDQRPVLDLWGLYASSHGCPNSHWISPSSSDCKKFTCNPGDLGLIPGLGRSPGGGHGNQLQYSYLENPMDRGAWWAVVHGVTRVGHDLATKPPPPRRPEQKYMSPPCATPLLLLPPVFISVRVFSKWVGFHIRWPKYWSFSFSLTVSLLDFKFFPWLLKISLYSNGLSFWALCRQWLHCTVKSPVLIEYAQYTSKNKDLFI